MAGIINNAIGNINQALSPPPVPTPTPTGTTPAINQAAAQTTAPTPVLPTNATASTYDPSKLSNPTAWNVTPDQTVQGQLSNILSNNSPIIQQARSGAIQTANDRGLANSSIAATGGESAAIASAVPIATSDAATVAKAAGYNADESNQFTVKNADITNTAAGFNAQQTQQASQVNAAAANQTEEFNSSQELQGAQFNVGQANATQLANIEANYKQLMQSSASASDLYKTTVDSIKQIQLSTDLNFEAKQSAVNQQLRLLQTGMSITGAIANLNLGSLVTFDNAPPLSDQSYANPNGTAANVAGGTNNGNASNGDYLNSIRNINNTM